MLDTCPPLGDVVIPTSFLVHPIIAGDQNYVLRDPLFEFKKVGPDATHLMALHLNLNSGTQVQWDPLFKFKKVGPDASYQLALHFRSNIEIYTCSKRS
jgi:hypothetical protein